MRLLSLRDVVDWDGSCTVYPCFLVKLLFLLPLLLLFLLSPLNI